MGIGHLWQDREADWSENGLLQVDLMNAFNSVSMEKMLEAFWRRANGAYMWMVNCYAHESPCSLRAWWCGADGDASRGSPWVHWGWRSHGRMAWRTWIGLSQTYGSVTTWTMGTCLVHYLHWGMPLNSWRPVRGNLDCR